jgi:CRISPR system Cascade subunit CasE
VVYSAGSTEPPARSGITTVVVRQGDVLRFRLVANPTVKRDGKRHGLLREEEQLAWLARKGHTGGFTLSTGGVVVVPLGGRQSHRHDPQRGAVGLVTHVGVRFDGLLMVNQSELFVQTLEAGIGSAKGFGFGLLSIAPRSE